MVNRLSKFKFKDREEEGIKLEQKNVAESKKECEKSLIVRIWGEKDANFSGIMSTFSLLWCSKGNLKVIELRHNFY